MIRLFFDGACQPINPNGSMGMGCVIYKDDEKIFEGNKFVLAAIGNSNNVAEYRALIMGLEWLINEGEYFREEINCFGDSKLVINQMLGVWSANGGYYFQDYLKAGQLLPRFLKLNFQWIPRDLNNEADDLSKEILRSNDVQIVDRDKASTGSYRKYSGFRRT